jgi:PEGA domain
MRFLELDQILHHGGHYLCMKPASSPSHDPSRSPDGSPLRPRLYTPGFSDALGDRKQMLENTNSAMAELLRFKREFSEAAGFETAIRQRIEELGSLHDLSVATIRRVEWLGAGEGLALISNQVAGRRLSELFNDVSGPAFAFEVIRQLAPALAAIQSQGEGIAHGLLTPERIVVTREGRLVIVEHVLGSAFELLQLPPSRLRSEFGLALPDDEVATLDQRSDVIQLGFIALSLLAGRRLDAAEYPDSVPGLLESYVRVDSLSSAHLRLWLEGALQLNRRPFDRPFDTAQDAHDAFNELSTELGPHSTESESVVLPFHASPDSASLPETGIDHESVAESEPEPAIQPQAITEAAKFDRRIEESPVELDSERPDLEQTLASPASRFQTLAGPAERMLKSLPLSPVRLAIAGTALVALVVVLFVFRPFSSNAPTPPPVAVATPPPAEPPPPAVPEPTFVGPLLDPARMAALASSTAEPASAPPKPATPAPAPAPTTSAATETTPAAPTGRFGGVRISAPIELQVFEAGNLVGSTAGPIAVMDGPHTFDLVNEALGYRSRQSVNVKPGQMSAVTIAVPNGRVSINAVPWADVWVDGKPAGQTPIANLALSIGQHEVVFRYPQSPDQRQTVMVKAEGVTMVSAKFQQ